ncbi:MAG: AAA family ATPase [Gammaproteobacteria bacterium]|nr:AAA family ATPase [Gammaproteobacteria bacterium]
MITNLRLANFKNFADESLVVGPFTVIVGANASGKSNIRDAFRFLHGIGRGYTLAEILGGRYGAGGQAEWNGIRGAADEIMRFEQPAMGMQVRLRSADEPWPTHDFWYRLWMASTNEAGFVVTGEALTVMGFRNAQATYTSHPAEGDPVRAQGDETHLLLRMEKARNQRKFGHRLAVRPAQPAITQLGEHKRALRRHKEEASKVVKVLGDMRFLEPAPDRMRQPAFPGQTVLGDSGDNLPTVLRKLCEDPARRETLLEWTRELTPMDVADFDFPIDPTTGWVQLAIKERDGRTVSAYSASDGTLRFLAMLATLLDDDTSGLHFFEEIDNGIHPSRLRLLVDLIESRTKEKDIQVVTTTHSPELLAMVNDSTFGNTSVVCRRPDRGDAVIRRIADLPNAEELRRTQGLNRLHMSGWLEDAVYFEEE